MSKRTSIVVPIVFLAALTLMGCGKSTPTTPVGGDTVAPAAVRDLQNWVSVGSTTTRVVVMWKPSPEIDLEGYRVYRSVNGGTNDLVGTIGVEGYTDDAVNEGSSYVYQVSAYDQSNNESVKSSTSPLLIPVRTGRDPGQRD